MSEEATDLLPDEGATDELLTIDELSAATGLSVRTTRYYAGLGLVPPPIRRGRVGYYGPEHRARLELVRALQDHGFTLQAIERYLARLPEDVTVEDLAMQRAMITSWTTEAPDDVQARIGRELLALGLPRDALAAAYAATSRHMAALAEELNGILREQVVDAFKRTHHTREEAAELEKALPRLRELTVEAIVVSFQDAANQVISRSLQRPR
ncbi:helix-turn-helix domain-containing protein [Nocardioides sp. KR10-350]|uniref:helix-turn-helix domain-containing protein n=1 Tax=Nocardioides cheoyonin TaxID=3156615 RepID=UPI0032B6102C